MEVVSGIFNKNNTNKKHSTKLDKYKTLKIKKNVFKIDILFYSQVLEL